MARKPADELARMPKPQGRQAIWTAMRARRAFTVPEIYADTDIDQATIRTYLRCLTAGGHVALDEARRFQADIYRLAKDTGAEAPRLREDGTPVTQGRGTEQMWGTMRRSRNSFTAGELSLMASTEAVAVTENAAAKYVLMMEKAGYVARLGNRRPTRWRFRHEADPGPKAPLVQRVQRVFDPNSGRVVWPVADDGGAP